MARGVRNAAHQIDEVAALRRRQAGGGLVEENKPRGPGERQTDLELALLAVREIADDGVDGRGQSSLLGKLARSCHVRMRASRTAQAKAVARGAADGKKEIVGNAQIAKQQRVLIGAAEAATNSVVGRQ